MGKYTCKEYREEMVLLGLRRRLNNPDLSKEEREEILKQIKKIEKEMGLD